MLFKISTFTVYGQKHCRSCSGSWTVSIRLTAVMMIWNIRSVAAQSSKIALKSKRAKSFIDWNWSCPILHMVPPLDQRHMYHTRALDFTFSQLNSQNLGGTTYFINESWQIKSEKGCWPLTHTSSSRYHHVHFRGIYKLETQTAISRYRPIVSQLIVHPATLLVKPTRWNITSRGVPLHCALYASRPK